MEWSLRDAPGGWTVSTQHQSCIVTEKLWFNFEPDRVHWVSCAGRNFTHRQTVKRKAASWGRRYRAMPRAERLAVLAAVMAVEAEA
ncbi:MAG: DNA methylase [bacterium]|nr:DNA methylase [bacterium]